MTEVTCRSMEWLHEWCSQTEDGDWHPNDCDPNRCVRLTPGMAQHLAGKTVKAKVALIGSGKPLSSTYEIVDSAIPPYRIPNWFILAENEVDMDPRNEREQALAIEMWQEIKAYIERQHFNLVAFKKHFCEEHDLYWLCNCWLCTLFSDYESFCWDCPLGGCGDSNSAYKRACLNQSKEACDEIIEAIRSVVV